MKNKKISCCQSSMSRVRRQVNISITLGRESAFFSRVTSWQLNKRMDKQNLNYHIFFLKKNQHTSKNDKILISMVRGCLLGYCLYVSAFLHLILAKRLRSDVSAFLKIGTNLKRKSILKTRKISSHLDLLSKWSRKFHK